MRVDCERKMVKLPKLDKIMKEDQFREILLQDVEGLGKDGKASWILILGSAVSYCISVNGWYGHSSKYLLCLNVFSCPSEVRMYSHLVIIKMSVMKND